MREDFQIRIETAPHDEDVRVLLKGIHDHNTAHSGGGEAEYLTIFLRDSLGEVVGGVDAVGVVGVGRERHGARQRHSAR